MTGECACREGLGMEMLPGEAAGVVTHPGAESTDETNNAGNGSGGAVPPQALRTGIADEIRRAYDAGEEHARKAVHWWIRVGDLLREAKRGIPHGQWATWVDENAPFGGRMARKYMQLSENAPAILAELAKRNSNAVLTIDSALALALAAEPKRDKPSDPLLAEHLAAFERANQRFVESMRGYLEHVKNAGEVLLKAKAELPEDEWLPWLAANVECSDTQAVEYMRVAQSWDEIRSMTESDAWEMLFAIVGLADGGGD